LFRFGLITFIISLL